MDSMDQSFETSPAGRLVPTIEGAKAFVPHPLPPPNIDLAAAASCLAEASQAIGELNGIGRILPNPYLLIRPLQRREALSSSSMEGTYSTLSDLVLLEAGADPDRPNDTREVLNYVRALDTSIKNLKDLPLSIRLIRGAHEILLQHVSRHRGASVRSGQLKTDQNWIGGKGSISSARFIPPPPKEAEEALSDLEKYLHREDKGGIPTLIDAALSHYQFETIHPFHDGNGRVGRMFITLLLMERGTLAQPLLYMSPYFEKHKDTYIDLMYEVSRSGKWSDWIEFFLTAVKESCIETTKVVESLQSLQKEYRDRFQKARSSSLILRIIDHAFERPAQTISILAERLDVSYQAISNNIKILVEEGVAFDTGQKYPRVIIFPEILKTLEAFNKG